MTETSTSLAHATRSPRRLSLQTPQPDVDDETEPLISLAPFKRWIGFGWRSMVRHPKRAIGAAIVVFGLAALALLSSPPTYASTASVLVLDGSTLRKAIDPRADDQAGLLGSGIQRTITRRAALDQIIDDAELIDNEADLPLFGKIKRKIVNTVFGETTGEARRRELRQLLSGSISVDVPNDQSAVYITVWWADPGQAVEIARIAQQLFLDSQRAIDVESLAQAVEILQQDFNDAKQTVDDLRARLNIPDTQDIPTGSPLETALIAQRNAQEQLNLAKVSLQAEKAAFDKRFPELEPAERPDRPLSSNVLPYAMTLVATLVGTALFCAWRELRRGAVVETWQLERCGLPVLAHVTKLG